MLRYPRILLLCSDELEADRIGEHLSKHACVSRACELSELSMLLESTCFDAAFCAWTFHRGTWKNALLEARRFQPDLPVLVFSSTGGEREWIEVLDSGAFDFLVPPYTRESVLALVEQAMASHDARILQRAAR
jgi:DNA-binding response OmpR family regulator